MRKIILSFVVGCLVILSMPGSSAHVEIVSAFPERLATVNPFPTEVMIEFSGKLQTLDGKAGNSLEVIDSTGIAINLGDPIIEGAKIVTKISDQSAPGVFTVKYRVVGEDGHVIEGDYTFNASPEFAEAVPTTALLEKDSELPVGGILLGGLLAIFLAGIILKAKNRRS
jgi:copper resistance protein C